MAFVAAGVIASLWVAAGVASVSIWVD